jgi:hypothetical protein
MEKKLYYKFSDGGSYSEVVMQLEDAFETIKAEVELSEGDEEYEEYEYTLVPVWLTEEEYNNLPEADL